MCVRARTLTLASWTCALLRPRSAAVSPRCPWGGGSWFGCPSRAWASPWTFASMCRRARQLPVVARPCPMQKGNLCGFFSTSTAMAKTTGWALRAFRAWPSFLQIARARWAASVASGSRRALAALGSGTSTQSFESATPCSRPWPPCWMRLPPPWSLWTGRAASMRKSASWVCRWAAMPRWSLRARHPGVFAVWPWPRAITRSPRWRSF
mmetsp:Transcript_93226/g.237147  ORF Transcript_93226/g.237147 Transcript_93226/m.237147 type:complete len:209 (+) Transcript_93226:375-1001(+)